MESALLFVQQQFTHFCIDYIFKQTETKQAIDEATFNRTIGANKHSKKKRKENTTTIMNTE